MTNEETVKRIQDGQGDLLGELYAQNYGFILKACKTYGKGSELEDLLQECFFAVSDAAAMYRPEAGASFASYLWFWLKQHIIRYKMECENLIRVPVYQRDRIRIYYSAVRKYRTAFGDDPDPRELARMLKVTPEQIEQLKQDAAALFIGSINAPVLDADGEGNEMQDFIPDDHNLAEEVIEGIQREELAALLWSMVDELGERPAGCLRMRYKDDMTLREVAAHYNLSPEAIRQICESGLRVLRRPKNIRRLKSFLDDYSLNEGIKGVSAGTFARTGMSATERAAIRLMDLKRRQHLEEIEL